MANTARDLHKALQDFLAWEEQQPERWEFLGGEARMMTGGTGAHSLIKMNSGSAFKSALRGSRCRPYDSDMKVITPHLDALYPDLSVHRGAAMLIEKALYDPVAVVEVLSPSSLADDYGRKRHAYQTIPSLRHYVIVAQDRALVEVYTRQEGAWLSETAEGLRASLRLRSLEVELRLADIYEDVLAA